MYKVLFVCTGNICRSPTAEGVFRHHVSEAGLDDKIYADSAALYNYHIGESPDPRTIKAAAGRGVSIEDQIARKVNPEDFEEFDLILGMDNGHYRELISYSPHGSKAKIELFLEYADHPSGGDVPDPYYGDESDFNYVFSLVEDASKLILEKILKEEI